MNGFVNIVDGFSQVAIDELKEQAETLYGGDGTEWVETTATLSTLASVVSGVTVPTKITVSNGTHASDITLSGSTDKVWIIAETQGSVVMTRTLNVDADNIILEGFKFNGGDESSDIGGNVYVNGNDCHITRNNFDDSQARKWLVTDFYAYRTEISYNIFQNKNNNLIGDEQRPRETVQLYFHTDDVNEHDHYVHHNHWIDIKEGKFSNAYEALQIYTIEDGEENSVNGANQNTLVEYNLFERCDGEGEIISNKCNASTIRYNTFKDCDGALTLRWGNGSEVYGNSMFDGKAGIVASGKYHKIYNNFVEGMAEEGILLREGAPGMDGYGAPDGVEIMFNTAKDCGNGALRIGKANTTEYGGEVIVNSTIANNIFLEGTGGYAMHITSPNSDAVALAGITFANDFYQGYVDFSIPNGCVNSDPQITNQSNGIDTPTAGSACLGTSATGEPTYVDTDIYGTTRPTNRSAGASEIAGANNPVLDSSDVGVDA